MVLVVVVIRGEIHPPPRELITELECKALTWCANATVRRCVDLYAVPYQHLPGTGNVPLITHLNTQTLRPVTHSLTHSSLVQCLSEISAEWSIG